MSDVVRKFAKKEREEGRAEGRAEERAREKKNTARRMINEKVVDDGFIAKITQLSIEEVRAIRQNPDL